MNGLRSMALAGVLAVGGLAGLGTAPARAQTYFPAAGYYDTATMGTVYIPAPGYYNVPSEGSYQPRGSGYTTPRAHYRVWTRAHRGSGGSANHPPYYSGALHSLHGRGFDSGRHGR